MSAMIETGKRYEITKHSPGGTETFTATVNWIEDKGDSWYIGYTPDDFRICRWGCLHKKKEGRYKAINYDFREVAA